MTVKKLDAFDGAVTYWEGATIGSQALEAAFEACDLPERLICRLGPLGALRLAAQSIAGGGIVRPLDKGRGLTIVDEERGDDENDYENRGAIVFDNGFKVVNGRYSRKGYRVTGSINKDLFDTAYERAENLVPAQQVGLTLARVVEHLGGLTLRHRSGGCYWLPAESLDTWRKLSDSLAPYGVTVWEIEHTLTPKSIKAVGDALTSEINETIDKMRDEICADDIGVRALETKKATCISLADRIKRYETILDTTLTDLKEGVDAALNAAAAAAIIAAGRKDEKNARA